MKIRQDKIKIRHRTGAPDKVRIITGPIDLTLERAQEPHEITRMEWETVFSSAVRALFEVVENPVVVSDPAVGGAGLTAGSPGPKTDANQSKPSPQSRATQPARPTGRRER